MGNRLKIEAFAKLRRAILAGATVIIALTPALSSAQDNAVSGLNGKLEGIGGVVDSEGTGAAAGSLAFPLGDNFGGQIDAAAGTIGANSLVGGGAHLFWRDPSIALAGLTASHTRLDGVDINRYGVEGEYYLGSFTILGAGGIQNGDLDNTVYWSADARYYATDNFMLEIGVSGFSGSRLGHLGIEWSPEVLGNRGSLFADGGVGNDDAEYGLAGLRFYFGETGKSLKRRHREDDPINTVFVTATQVQAGTAASGGVSEAASGTVCPPEKVLIGGACF